MGEVWNPMFPFELHLYVPMKFLGVCDGKNVV